MPSCTCSKYKRKEWSLISMDHVNSLTLESGLFQDLHSIEFTAVSAGVLAYKKYLWNKERNDYDRGCLAKAITKTGCKVQGKMKAFVFAFTDSVSSLCSFTAGQQGFYDLHKKNTKVALPDKEINAKKYIHCFSQKKEEKRKEKINHWRPLKKNSLPFRKILGQELVTARTGLERLFRSLPWWFLSLQWLVPNRWSRCRPPCHHSDSHPATTKKE